jgi:predicted nucleic acid-binding protein
MARLIDTSVFIDLLRRGDSIRVVDANLQGEPFALASITASELLVGVYRTIPGRNRELQLDFVETLLRDAPVLAFDLDIARSHAQFVAGLAATGQMIGANDLLIAATALSRGYSVLTHNLRHFKRVPGLVVNAPSW